MVKGCFASREHRARSLLGQLPTFQLDSEMLSLVFGLIDWPFLLKIAWCRVWVRSVSRFFIGEGVYIDWVCAKMHTEHEGR